jgi:hypothetical protein
MSTTTTTGTPDDMKPYATCPNCGNVRRNLSCDCVERCDTCGSYMTVSWPFDPAPPATTPPTSAIQHTLTRESWRYLFAGLIMSNYSQFANVAYATAQSVSGADALLAELERTAKP